MPMMSVSHNGGGPPLPKRTTSQRQPRVTANPALSQNGRSNSTDAPPPLPPHHPGPNTLPRRAHKSESDASSSRAVPDLALRTHSEHAHGIQRKNFETNSFIERNTAKIFSDPTKFETKSMKLRRSYNTESAQDQHSRHTEQFSKQNSRDRPLPPPPSQDTISSTQIQKRPSLTNEPQNKDKPLPPPPSISSIPTGRRQPIPEQEQQHDPTLPPPPPIQSIPTATPARDKTYHVTAAFEEPDTPPPPPARRPTIHVQLKQEPSDEPPPLPPSRPRTKSSSSHSTKNNSTDPHDYEKRFVFHDESEFPDPEKFLNVKKEYPSQALKKRKPKETSSLGAL